jgi:prevent-host-death family protein
MKTLEVDELTKRINEILRIVEEGETIELTKRGEVVARLVPARRPQQPVKRDLKDFWAEMDRLAVEIGARWKGDMDAVEAVRDVRREL